jgi:predicted transcriptional regulator
VEHPDDCGYPVPQEVFQDVGDRAMAAGITTSIRMPREVCNLYETIAQATGRARNDLMVEALLIEGRRWVNEIAMILEGGVQARAGQLSPIEEVLARFKDRGILPDSFDVHVSDADTGVV